MNTIQNAMNRIATIEAANAQNEARQAELAVEQSAVSAATSSLQKKIRFAQLKKQYDVRERVSPREAALAAARENSKFLLARIEKETLAFIAAERAQPDRSKSEQAMIAELPAAVTPISPAGTSQIIPLTPAVKAKLKGKTSKERQAAPLHREGFRLLK